MLCLQVDLALLRGLSRRRLPPHLLNILNDRRSAAVLYRLGKLDPLMSLFEQVRNPQAPKFRHHTPTPGP